MSIPRRVLAVSVLACVLGAGGWTRAQQPAPKSGDLLVYYCNNLTIVTVRVRSQQVEVATPTRKAVLNELPASSAFQYGDGSVTLSRLEEHVRIEEPGAVYFCRSIPAEVPWEDARLRGIEFRAAGENPAWAVEIDEGVGIEFTWGTGAERATTKFPAVPLKGNEKRLTLLAVGGGHTLALAAESRVCNMGGSTMTLAVTATLDGRTFTGCGRLFR